jgi:hypothetical protein
MTLGIDSVSFSMLFQTGHGFKAQPSETQRGHRLVLI